MKDCVGKDPISISKGLFVLLDEDKKNGDHVTTAGHLCDRDRANSIEKSLNHVFNTNSCAEEGFLVDGKLHVENVSNFLQKAFQDLPKVDVHLRDGISCGTDHGVVEIDKLSKVGDIKFIGNGLVLESQAVFSSVRANTCVSRGKWMYEVTLETAGIQQLGWATAACKFTREEGVGDSPNSYAYDGRRVRKWCVSWDPYGQPWVSGDVIGCCIDLDVGEISFLRNGVSLGVAYAEDKNPTSQLPYYPAISLSQGERCELNFGGRPFKYPVESFQPLQSAPSIKENGTLFQSLPRAQYLLGCYHRLLQLDSEVVIGTMSPVDRLGRLKPLGNEYSDVVGREICKLFVDLLDTEQPRDNSLEYLTWSAIVPFLMELHRHRPPHDSVTVDNALSQLLSFLDTENVLVCVCEIMEALAFGCQTSPIVLAESPYTASYPYLALACHLLHRQDILQNWCNSKGFELCLEGLLSRKGPNKYDLESLMPTVWWPGSREDSCTESNMRQTAQALSKTISKVEDMQWELCHILLDYVPPTEAESSGSSDDLVNSGIKHPSGSVFMSFLRHLVTKNKGAARNIPPPGLSDNSVLMTAYTVLLRFLSEGFVSNTNKAAGKEQDIEVAFLHRGGKRSFNVQLFLDADSYVNDFARLGGTFSHLCKVHTLIPSDYESVVWEESCMDDSERRVTHGGKQKPCCCSGASGSQSNASKGYVRVLNKGFNIHVNSVSESSRSSRSEPGRRMCTDDEDEKPTSSGRVDPFIRSSSYHELRNRTSSKVFTSGSVREEELLDIMVLLYHLGVAPNFKQASYYLQHQLQSITQLDDTDRQIRVEKPSNDHLKRLKEARAVYREDLIECVRQSTWYKVCLFSKWKQRGMFATCMWIVQLLLMMSNRDELFSFVPEYYVETLLDCFHALRRSDPLFVSPTALLQQGLSALITFLVTHFNDARIANSDIRDSLLQSISVLVQYKEHVNAFELNSAAVEKMPAALLSAFDNRFWIPVTNILLRLCKGTGFGSSKSSTHGESCSQKFQELLRLKCVEDEKLFSSFLNRLFNTLNWTITEFSVSMKEMQEQSEQRQVPDLQQRKCSIMFELSCNLERILEFFTRELPEAFLCGSETNLVRLCELLMFVLSRTTSSTDVAFFESSLRHQGQSLEKINRAMILAPLVGIILNLFAAKENTRARHDVAQAILNVDVSSVATRNFDYLLQFNWGIAFKGDPSLVRLPYLKEFVRQLKTEALVVREREIKEALTSVIDYNQGNNAGEDKEDICSICYACEINTIFIPCNHKSCWRCISRHLLNNQRCFFCNALVQDLRSMSVMQSSGHDQLDSGEPNQTVGESGLLVKIDSS
uniref:RING-type E3 ubiquitin transferase n=1 Tax=Marsilea vestita TaxID=59764 RepID=I6WUM9_MARVE|nr:E3 ubiquitin protein ligase-like protein [Marsilea vestita]